MVPALFIGIAFALFSCSSQEKPKINQNTSGFAQVASDAQYDSELLLSDSARNSKASAMNDFAFSLFNEINKANQDNVLFSPISLQAAFALAEPAFVTEDSKAALAQALRITPGENDRKAMHDIFFDLNNAMTNQRAEAEKKTLLKISNRAWLETNQKANIKSSYLDQLKKYFNAGLSLVDFAQNPENARRTINDQISLETNELIPELLGQGAVTASTKFILTNSVYFKAFWPKEFSAPQNEPFTNANGSTKSVPTLSDLSSLPYSEDETMQAVMKPYADGRTGLLVLLPKEGKTINDILAKVTNGASFQATVKQLRETDVELHLPTFEFSSSPAIDKLLQALGGAALFSAPLDILTTSPLQISAVVHQAKIILTRYGTEAAAATAIIMTTSMPQLPQEYKVMKVNRPALFFIIDKETQSILFFGSLAKF